jgi:hypothetical protein
MTIGLTLTVMLVMYTMYQSILASITHTAYLKMLDYWLLFCLLTPFLVFTIEVYWLLKASKSSNRQGKIWYWKTLDLLLSQEFLKYFMPAITCMFVLSYILTAIAISVSDYTY